MLKKARSSLKKGRKKVQSKRIIIDGIEFASMLEGVMYTLLKEAGIVNFYEGNSYVTFTKFRYKGLCYERFRKDSASMKTRVNVEGVSYTPDFVGENEEWFIEVKGRPNESFPIRWKLFKQLMNQRENPPMIFMPKNTKDCEQVINILKNKGYGRK